jgi:hypothetical protein
MGVTEDWYRTDGGRFSEAKAAAIATKNRDLSEKLKGIARGGKRKSSETENNHQEETKMPKFIKCPECGKQDKHYSRGLCRKCYDRLYLKEKALKMLEATNNQQLDKNSDLKIPEKSNLPETNESLFPDTGHAAMKPKKLIKIMLDLPHNFSGLVNMINQEASNELRTMENQIIWILVQHFNPMSRRA